MKRFAFTIGAFCRKAFCTCKPYIGLSLISIFLLLNISVLQAQIKPDATVATPDATGNIAIPYKPADYAAGGNYIRIYQTQQPTTDVTYVTSSSRTVDQVNVSTQYFDGLGRPLQTVNWQASPGKQDIVAPVVYDEMGREQYKFLPYTSPTASTSGNPGQFKTNPFTEQSTFYTTTYKIEQPALANEKLFYSKTNFDASPLSRVSETYAPGNSWAGSEGGSAPKKVSMQYMTNTGATGDNVQIWTIGFNATIADNTNIATNSGAYGAGLLFKTVTTDEAGNATVEYKDKQGHVILKKVQIGTIATDFSGYSGFLCTYYIYDDLGQLRTVLQPKAVAAMITAGNWVLTQTIVNELCFRYEYDQWQRMIAKKVPGAAWVYMVYDLRDRLAFSQDGNMRGKSQWMYTVYDDFNRPVQTGIMSYTGSWATLVAGMPTTSTSTTTTASGTNENINPADMYINSRENGRAAYNATNSIVFDNGFTSEDNASFTAQITTETASTFSNPVTVNTFYTPTGATLYPLTYTYFTDYAAATKTYSAVNNSKLDNGGNPYPETLPSINSTLTKGMVTVTKVRVIEDPNNLTLGKWLETVNFYDDKGRVIQMQNTNYKGGNDIVTNRYDFTNKVVSSYVVHNNVSGNVNNLRVLTSMNYDHAGRLKTITKTINDDATNNKRVIATNIYDALGKLKEKKTGQKSSTDPTALEDDNYNYNIRGWLKDINYYSSAGAYASQVSMTSNKWFSMDLSYDWGFGTSSQYNGNISGTRWKTAGDGQERAYGFAYDKANRLLKGDFTQNNSGWAIDPIVDFSMKIGDGISDSTYDENGNIIKMWQKGITGVTNSIIDNLTYSYFANSNKLSAVGEATPVDNKLGDFTDNHTSGNDYGYDVNGNLITDLNKRINGTTGTDFTSGGAITYNFLNLPLVVTVKNADGSPKGTITYIYDAAGNKLEKRVIEGASTQPTKQTTTSYLGSFVYENNVLQFFSHEDGRVRYKADSNSYVFDYFLKDHLGNVRMVLTDEQKSDQYPAVTFEDASLANEQVYYENVDVQRTLKPNEFFTSQTNGAKAQLLRKTTSAIGAGELLKVMAGDQIITKFDYYIPTQTTDNSAANGLSSIINSLLNFLNGADAPAALKGSGTPITNALNSSSPFTTFMASEGTGIVSPSPKAYLNIIFFDEQFKFVQTGSQLIPANVEGTAQHVVKIGIDAAVAPKNGYVYIYLSNESNNLVYFDNLQVTHLKGPILEETHYYPFGLTMAGISSKAAGSLGNEIKFNGKELNEDLNLDWYEYGFRNNFDPQLGRFHSVDPLASDYPYYTPFQFAGNRPTIAVDVDGLEPAFVNDIFNWLVPKAVENPNGAAAKTIGVVAGTGKFIEKTVTGAANIFTNPPDLSVQGSANSAVQLGLAVNDRVNTIQNGSTVEKTAAITETVLDVASVVVGAKGVGAGVKSAGAAGEVAGIANSIPGQVARVIPNSVGEVTTLGRAGAADVFVTASSDIKGLNATQIAKKLTIPESGTGFKVITFETPQGIASPINRSTPGFVGGGRTAGGAREFVVPNQPIPKNAKIKTVN